VHRDLHVLHHPRPWAVPKLLERAKELDEGSEEGQERLRELHRRPLERHFGIVQE